MRNWDFAARRDDEFELQQEKSVVELWTLSPSTLPQICDAYASGERELATELVFEEALSIGSIIPSRPRTCHRFFPQGMSGEFCEPNTGVNVYTFNDACPRLPIQAYDSQLLREPEQCLLYG